MGVAHDWIESEPRFMTVEEFLALPDDGVHRELIRGVVRENEMTYRNRFHASTETKIAQFLANWSDERPEPRGEVVDGEAGFRLRGTKESLVGIDVAYVSPELLAATGPKQAIFDGPPVLAVEILSPSDQNDDVLEKIETYLDAGVAVVWEVEPRLRTVRVHRPGQDPVMFNASQELTAEPELPGFRVPVARLFSARTK
jgi:Uma2 family endonuclease